MLVIYKKSSYQIYIRERRNSRIQELLEAGDPYVLRLKRAHEHHEGALREARTALSRLGTRAVFRYRSEPGTIDGFNLVVTLGGDGTLLWASHNVGAGCPVVAVNTAPKDSVGFFCAGTSANLEDVLRRALQGQLPSTRLSRMRVELDGQVVSNRVLNDALFCHECPAATARYAIGVGEQEVEHKSSGVWVGPAAGSTAALRSAGGRVMPVSSRRLQFVVREPYTPDGKAPGLAQGFLRPGERLRLRSLFRAGRLYLDGPHLARHVDIGSELHMLLSDEPLTLLGFDRDRLQ